MWNCWKIFEQKVFLKYRELSKPTPRKTKQNNPIKKEALEMNKTENSQKKKYKWLRNILKSVEYQGNVN